ncbi:MAG: hypothetical protein KC422_14005 [Trueperaceae bacterium]|nr:hypothetical protein [Trueperaceae bacterium]
MALQIAPKWTGKTYLWWLGANGLAELLGLGATGLLGYLLISRLGDSRVLLFASSMVLAGIIFEGVAVGLFQWLVLRLALPKLKASRWIIATALGAGVAWLLGMIPSTLLSFEADRAGTSSEPSLTMMMFMALLMGAILGPILGFFQYRVLRDFSPKAGFWIGANSLAWAAGMAIIFAGIDIAFKLPYAPVYLALSLILCGFCVAAIHGLFLFFIVGRCRTNSDSVVRP